MGCTHACTQLWIHFTCTALNVQGEAIWNGTLPWCHQKCGANTKEESCQLDDACLECTDHCRFADVDNAQVEFIECIRCVQTTAYYNSACNRRCGGMGFGGAVDGAYMPWNLDLNGKAVGQYMGQFNKSEVYLAS